MVESAKHNIGNNDHASGLLGDLYDRIHNQPSPYFYEETDQSPPRLPTARPTGRRRPEPNPKRIPAVWPTLESPTLGCTHAGFTPPASPWTRCPVRSRINSTGR
ncbi:hypothetical protein Ssi03_08470 [Sphaerisporangium siamense]|nr:hypothetical protein Ssi03_08470 [Sphaerisporangium siamense]